MTEVAADNQSPPRICVVVPVYNNESTVAALVRRVVRGSFVPIVVDDGSTDESGRLAASIPEAHLVTHTSNMGKGAALLSGFGKARELGFTHAIVMDADGQHDGDDLPGLVDEVHCDPSAIVVGVRELAGSLRALKSRVLRAHSNFWVWTETGRCIRDTQSGLRAYPLEQVAELALKTRRYDFETEILVKAMWAGVPVREVRVSTTYGKGSKSHFRPVVDFLRNARLNAALFVEAMFLPAGLRRQMHLARHADVSFAAKARRIIRGIVLQDSAGPALLAASVGVGVCFGILPIWGFQMIAAFFVAHRLGLSKAVVLAASNISIPAIMPFILYASLVTGRLVLRGRVDFSLELAPPYLANAWHHTWDYLVGAVVLAFAAGVLAWAAVWAVWLAGKRVRRAS